MSRPKVWICLGPNNEYYGCFDREQSAKHSFMISYSKLGAVRFEPSKRQNEETVVSLGDEVVGFIRHDEVHAEETHL